MKRLWVQTLLALSLVGGLLAFRLAAPRANTILTEQRLLMGTAWSLQVPLNGHPAAEARLALAAAWHELDRVEALMSEWLPASPLSQLNAAAGVHPVEVPPELRQLLERSLRYSSQTEGTFDITWRGMGRIWHFDDTFRVPTAAEVALARRNVDYRRVRITGNSVWLPAGTNLGLGGIAKGYAIDRAALVLKQHGFPDSLVDGGGDILACGTRFGKPWQVGVQAPRAPRGTLLGIVELSNAALVSSGDYERFRLVNGIRYHHLIDPGTGWPATASIATTVLAPTAEAGVVFGKAVFILGPEKGLRLAHAQGLEALLLDPAQKQHATPGFLKVFRPVSAEPH